MQRKSRFALLVVAFWCTLISLSQAAIELELTQGIRKALPIAVASFDGEARLSSSNTLSKIIRNDLQNSGRFRLINLTAEQANNLSQAKSKGANDVLTGSVEPVGEHHYRVKYRLQDALGSQKIILNKQYTVNDGSLRRLAHKISDQIYYKLTGTRGVFSTQIAYILVKNSRSKQPEYALEVADYDGFNPHALVLSREPLMSPAWSPDAKKIAYVSFDHKRAQIFVIDVATGKQEKITSFPGINGAPAWSPDGSKLAVVLSKNVAPKIFVVDLASKKIRQITHGNSIDTEPSFTPDGGHIVFTSNRGGSVQIYRVDLKSDSITRLTFTGRYNARPSISRDGKSMVVMHRNGSFFNIAIQDLSSGIVDVLTHSVQDESPSLAPNDRLVLYATQYGGKGVLSIVSTDGQVKLRLPSRDGDVQEPAWSPYVA